MPSFNVTENACDQCLFSANRIVTKERKDEIIENCLKYDRYFVCHKTANNCCYGFYQKHKTDIWPIRLARMQRIVNFKSKGD